MPIESFAMRTKAHNERCRDCKENVRNLLAAMFGKVEVNYDLNLPCKLEDYKNTNIHKHIEEIYQALLGYRGYDNFVRAKRLPKVDFFIPDQKLIVEFDESQHFTEPRAIALGLYPNKDDFGFSLEKWSNLCRDLDKRDNDPPYRDEQRAWYDTLRDFVPLFWGAGKTVRLYSRDFVWCSLNPNKESDLQALRQLKINKKDMQG